VGKYLVVANQTVGGPQFLDAVRRRANAGPSSFYVVVPNTHPVDLAPASGAPVPPGFGSTTVDESYRATQIAQSRLTLALNQLHAEGVEATGELGDPEPLTAIGDALAAGGYDEIIISTLPPGLSRWLGMDLPSRTERRFKLPVTTIIASN
jgi:GABA permease